MPDLRLPEATWGRPPGRTMKRKRSYTNFDIAVDPDSQVDPIKRQIRDDSRYNIEITPSHLIPDVPDSAATEPAAPMSNEDPQPMQLQASLQTRKSYRNVTRPSLLQTSQTITSQQFQSIRSPTLLSKSEPSKKSTSAPKHQQSQQSTSPPEPQSFNLPASASTRPYSIPELETLSADKHLEKANDESKIPQKWEAKVWDANEYDSDEEDMSLAVTMKLANELSLLESFLGMYKKFNIHLGDIVSGPRHKGFLTLITSTVVRLESHTTQLRFLRHEKQRGDPTPSNLELIAEKITRKFRNRRKYLWDVMEEKVDMTNDVARAMWVKKKKAVLGNVMGGLVGYLEELDGEEEREVRKMEERWEKRWKAYGAMDRGDLKEAGWILEVGE